MVILLWLKTSLVMFPSETKNSRKTEIENLTCNKDKKLFKCSIKKISRLLYSTAFQKFSLVVP